MEGGPARLLARARGGDDEEVVMKAFAGLALLIALSAGMAGMGSALAWQMESVESGQGQNIIDSDPSSSGIGGGAGSSSSAGPLIRIEPVQPGGRGPLFDDDRRRPALFGEGREPLYRPGSARNCSGEGPGRVCF